MRTTKGVLFYGVSTYIQDHISVTADAVPLLFIYRWGTKKLPELGRSEVTFPSATAATSCLCTLYPIELALGAQKRDRV